MAGTTARESVEGSVPGLSIPFPQDSEDEFALAALGISDGHQPSSMSNATRQNLALHSSSQSNMMSSERSTAPPPRPSSTSKPSKMESFALQHDGAMGHLRRDPSSGEGSSNAQRNLARASILSTTSDVHVRDEEPYSGPTAPSFNYAMNTQQSRDIRASLATTVVRSERSYRGPTAPVHPYGMYPQNTAAESVSGRGVPPATIAAGFPGRHNNYLRRIGPDGEEIGDIIGPDGHTEALPPYTQYPDEAFARKARLAEARVAVDGAGGIGLATRNPEFEPRENLSRASSQHSARSTVSSQQRPASQSVAPEPEISEKRPLKKWQVKAKKKVCGIIPLWALLFAAAVLIVFTLLLSVMLYALKPKPRNPRYNPPAEGIILSSSTRTFDATPFTTIPTGLPTLPTGTYALPIAAPSAVQNSCLLQTQQSKAWSCAMPQSPLQMQILDLPGGRPLSNKEIILDYGKAAVTNYPYGTQPPVLNEPQVLNLVIDTQDPRRGPAWFFQTIYNKVVVVPEDLLSSPYDQKKKVSVRDGHSHHVDEIPFNEKNFAQPGQAPWFCYWNGTLLEAFLYVNQTSSEAAHGSGHEAEHSTSTTSSTSSMATKTSWTIATATPPSNKTQTKGQDPWGPEHEALSAYPKVLKFQERRVPCPQSIPPYCTKKLIAADGSAQDMKNSTGQVITIFLNETIPEEFEPLMKRVVELASESEGIAAKIVDRQSSSSDKNIDDDDRNCGCAWLAT